RDLIVTGVQTCALPIWVLPPKQPPTRSRPNHPSDRPPAHTGGRAGRRAGGRAGPPAGGQRRLRRKRGLTSKSTDGRKATVAALLVTMVSATRTPSRTCTLNNDSARQR